MWNAILAVPAFILISGMCRYVVSLEKGLEMFLFKKLIGLGYKIA